MQLDGNADRPTATAGYRFRLVARAFGPSGRASELL
jgi:hypothetical protein